MKNTILQPQMITIHPNDDFDHLRISVLFSGPLDWTKFKRYNIIGEAFELIR